MTKLQNAIMERAYWQQKVAGMHRQGGVDEDFIDTLIYWEQQVKLLLDDYKVNYPPLEA